MEFKLPEGVDSMQLMGDSGSNDFVIPVEENEISIQANSANKPIPKGRTSPFQGKDGLVRFSAYASEQRDERDRNATLESKPIENKNLEDDDDKLQFAMDGFTGGRRKSKRKRKKKKRKTKKKKRKPRRKSRKRRRKRKTKRKFRNQRGCKR